MKSVTRLLPLLPPGLKMARKGGELLPKALPPHRPHSGCRRRFPGEKAAGPGPGLAAAPLPSRPGPGPAAPREGQDGGGASQSPRSAGSRPPAAQCRRSACPGRFHWAPSPPARLPAWARPLAIKGSAAHMCSSVPAGAGRGGGSAGGVGRERERWGSGVSHSHRAAPRCPCPRPL